MCARPPPRGARREGPASQRPFAASSGWRERRVEHVPQGRVGAGPRLTKPPSPPGGVALHAARIGGGAAIGIDARRRGETALRPCRPHFDLVAAGEPSVSFGFDQGTPASFTTPFAISPDTYTGGVIPMPLRGPTFSLKVDFAPGEAWTLWSATLYLSESRGSP